jgi:hypothetical protein
VNPVSSWQNQLLSRPLDHIDSNALQLEIVDFTRPQKHFVYPEFPTLGSKALENPAEFLKNLLSNPLFENFRLFDNLCTSYIHFFENIMAANTSKKIASIGPPSTELTQAAAQLKLTLEILSCDPEEIINTLAQNQFSAICFSNPNRINGFFYPHELFADLYLKIRNFSDTVFIISDESLALFTFNLIAPGSLRAGLKKDSRLYIASSIYPVMSPQGPELSWLIHSINTTMPSKSLNPLPNIEEQIFASRAVSAFQSRHGKAAAEFSRRMLAVDRGIKTLTVHLQKLVHEKKIHIHSWPESGFYLSFEVLNMGSCQTIQEWCETLFQKTGILLLPGSFFHQPKQAALCYAASINFLDRNGKRLYDYFMSSDL